MNLLFLRKRDQILFFFLKANAKIIPPLLYVVTCLIINIHEVLGFSMNNPGLNELRIADGLLDRDLSDRNKYRTGSRNLSVG